MTGWPIRYKFVVTQEIKENILYVIHKELAELEEEEVYNHWIHMIVEIKRLKYESDEKVKEYMLRNGISLYAKII